MICNRLLAVHSLSYRQANLERTYHTLYLPARVMLERDTEKQADMKRRAEDTFREEFGDYTELRGT